MNNLNAIPIANKEVVTRRIADELLLVPIRHTAKDVDSIYTLNETAAFIWECVDGKTSITEIIDFVITTFAVPREEAATDVFALFTDLKNLGFITC